MNPPRHDKQLMAAADAAKELGVSRQRIHQLVKERKLTGLRDRSFLYVRRDEIEAMKAARALPAGWLTKNDVAERFGVAPRTVQDWYQNGHLPGQMTAARRLVFKVADVEAFTPPPRGRPPSSA